MKDNYKLLNKLKASIAAAFPEASDHDAMIISGFAALYCTAQEDIKVFLKTVMREAMDDARKINAKSMEELKNKIDEIKSKEVENDKKDILN